MKKIFYAMLIVILMFAFTGCGKKGKKTSDSSMVNTNSDKVLADESGNDESIKESTDESKSSDSASNQADDNETDEKSDDNKGDDDSDKEEPSSDEKREDENKNDDTKKNDDAKKPEKNNTSTPVPEKQDDKNRVTEPAKPSNSPSRVTSAPQNTQKPTSTPKSDNTSTQIKADKLIKATAVFTGFVNNNSASILTYDIRIENISDKIISIDSISTPVEGKMVAGEGTVAYSGRYYINDDPKKFYTFSQLSPGKWKTSTYCPWNVAPYFKAANKVTINFNYDSKLYSLDVPVTKEVTPEPTATPKPSVTPISINTPTPIKADKLIEAEIYFDGYVSEDSSYRYYAISIENISDSYITIDSINTSAAGKMVAGTEFIMFGKSYVDENKKNEFSLISPGKSQTSLYTPNYLYPGLKAADKVTIKFYYNSKLYSLDVPVVIKISPTVTIVTPKPTATPVPTATPRPTNTPKPTATPTPIPIGSTIKLGKYEQDNNTANGKENIEWIVIDSKSDRILVISKYILDCKAYEEVIERGIRQYKYTWENCSLRNWLNKEFIQDSFSSKEISRILETKIITNNGDQKDTVDKVFALDVEEVRTYLSNRSYRMTTKTKWAKTKELSDDWDWWLRTRSFYDTAWYVGSNGDLFNGAYMDTSKGIRPAMWIKLQ